MADSWGIQTWDAQGNASNYGINPTNVVGTFYLTDNQVSGSYRFPVPAGCRLEVMTVSQNFSYRTDQRRKFVVSGGVITVMNGAGNFSTETDQATEAWVLVIAVRG